MNKKSMLYILLDLVFLAVFNLVFFVVGGTEHAVSVWLAYGFIHFAYIMVLLTPLFAGKSSSAAVFGMSLCSISAMYFFVEFIIGMIFVFIAGDSYKMSLVVQVVVAGVYIAVLLANLIVNERSAENVAKHESEVAYLKSVAANLKALMGKASDKKANKEIEKAYDAVHSSPVKSSAAVREIEKRIDRVVAELCDAVKCDDSAQIIAVAQEIILLTEERNRNLKLSN